jgi:hypothetical protein
MAEESTLGLSSLTGILVLVFLFITWYRSRDPLVSPLVMITNPVLIYCRTSSMLYLPSDILALSCHTYLLFATNSWTAGR